MARAAMIFGILAGMFGLLVGLFGYSLFAAASATGMVGGEAVQFISIAIPLASLIAGGMATSNAAVAGVLMLLSALGLLSLFGLNAFTVVPFVLNGAGSAFAFMVAMDAKRGAPAKKPALEEERCEEPKPPMNGDATEKGLTSEESRDIVTRGSSPAVLREEETRRSVSDDRSRFAVDFRFELTRDFH